ncbi:Caldesmon [Flavobacteriaceae bacterium CRH]|nr:Caldesmon [Flavobacteriaceae bacterium CRH]
MAEQSSIQCPNCGTNIDVNDILKHQLEDSIRKEYQQKANAQKQELELRNEQFEKAKAEFEAKKKQENELFAERLEREKKTAEKEITEKVKNKLDEENKDRMLLMEKELSEKSEKLRELNKMTGEIAKLQREKLEMKEAIEAEAQKQLNATLVLERDKIRKQEEEKNELKIKEYQKQSDDQKKLIEEMKRKQEQGSMQLQGEVMELAIEEWLANNFPLDSIDEVKKGANGADCLQIVNTRELQNCGSIYYESKRTKAFQPAWIEKFKNDIRTKRANIGVLVTEVMPAGMDRMGMRDGIWICTYEEFKGLSAVLRQSLIQVSQAVQAQENKGDKMSMLYDFLTSNEFRLQIEGIVEGFTQMQGDLDAEKRAMQRIWKQREKQIEKVVHNTLGMYGSIRGIAGNAVQTVRALELDFIEDDNEDPKELLE